jgi:hypothetical protein
MSNEEKWYKCSKCNKEYLYEDLEFYAKNGFYTWELCKTCEANIDYIIRHNINPCSTCVVKGEKA